MLKVKVSGDYLFILCPFHKERNPSCLVSMERNRFHCFGCGESGSLAYLKEKIGPEWDVLRRVPMASPSNRAKACLDTMYASMKGITGASGVFLANKGISLKVAKEFGIRGNDLAIMAPIFVGKTLEGLLIRGFPKKYTFYGRKRLLLKGDINVVVFVESIWAAMKLFAEGISVACMFGVTLSPLQIEDIKAAHIKKILIAYDKDPGGERGVALLKKHFKGEIIEFPDQIRDAEDAVSQIKSVYVKMKRRS